MAKGFDDVIKAAVARTQGAAVVKTQTTIAKKAISTHRQAIGGDVEVERIVDGRVGAQEASVRPFGRIAYTVNLLRAAAIDGIAMAEEESPVDTGTYVESWVVEVAGAEVAADKVPALADEVVIINRQPYSRYINVGKRADGTPNVVDVEPLFVERAALRLEQKHGQFVKVAVEYRDNGAVARGSPCIVIRRQA